MLAKYFDVKNCFMDHDCCIFGLAFNCFTLEFPYTYCLDFQSSSHPTKPYYPVSLMGQDIYMNFQSPQKKEIRFPTLPFPI